MFRTFKSTSCHTRWLLYAYVRHLGLVPSHLPSKTNAPTHNSSKKDSIIGLFVHHTQQTRLRVGLKYSFLGILQLAVGTYLVQLGGRPALAPASRRIVHSRHLRETTTRTRDGTRGDDGCAGKRGIEVGKVYRRSSAAMQSYLRFPEKLRS